MPSGTLMVGRSKWKPLLLVPGSLFGSACPPPGESDPKSKWGNDGAGGRCWAMMLLARARGDGRTGVGGGERSLAVTACRGGDITGLACRGWKGPVG